MELFERASRAKLRFSMSRGEASAEDLWDLSLESLNTIAVKVNKAIKDEGEESFIETKSKALTQNQLRLDILKHVIKAKQDAKTAATTRALNQAKAGQLKQLIADKSNEALANKTIEELQGMLGEVVQDEEETLTY